MNANPLTPGNTTRFENGVLDKADVLAIFQPLTEEQARPFGDQLDADLARLEEQFAQFTTVKSMRGSLGR